MATESGHSRRQFLLTGTATGTGVLIAGIAAAAPAGENAKADPTKSEAPAPDEISPPEDLMREHGVLNRILLIYEECLRRLRAEGNLEPTPLAGSAKIIRTFIEDYHEKLEEDHLFPRFERAAQTRRSRQSASRATSSRPPAHRPDYAVGDSPSAERCPGKQGTLPVAPPVHPHVSAA